jgi:hypothetical protein
MDLRHLRYFAVDKCRILGEAEQMTRHGIVGSVSGVADRIPAA